MLSITAVEAHAYVSMCQLVMWVSSHAYEMNLARTSDEFATDNATVLTAATNSTAVTRPNILRFSFAVVNVFLFGFAFSFMFYAFICCLTFYFFAFCIF